MLIYSYLLLSSGGFFKNLIAQEEEKWNYGSQNNKMKM